jgi:hypothetical protein
MALDVGKALTAPGGTLDDAGQRFGEGPSDRPVQHRRTVEP